MLILALALLILWLILKIGILFWLFIIATLFGVILMIAGGVGNGVGGRRYWY